VAAAVFPAASCAVTVTRFDPDASGIEALQEVVPDAVPLPAVAPFVHVTDVTPTLSEAVPLIASGVADVEKVAPGGVVIDTAGGVVSPGV